MTAEAPRVDRASSPPGGVLDPSLRALSIGLVLTVTLVGFEALAVATALPAAADDLGGVRLYGWVFSAFLLTSLVGIAFAGERSDAVGPASPYLLGLLLFGLGLVIGGLAPSMLLLVLARALQGLGAGAIPAVSYVVIGRAYPERLRPRMPRVRSRQRRSRRSRNRGSRRQGRVCVGSVRRRWRGCSPARGSRYRLDAEMIRDQVLATSGLLSPTMYGQSVKPPQPDGLWKAVTMIGERYKPDSGEAIYRRSIYTYWKRGMPPPQMTILNAPIRDSCIARRERTNTPSQALLLLNESEYLKAARNLAQTILRESGSETPQRLEMAYETVTSLLPDEKERAILTKLLEDLQENYRDSPALADELCEGLSLTDAEEKAQLAAWTVLVNTLYNLDITKTRQ